MQIINRLIEVLKPFRDLIVIVVALVSAGYGAIPYFATADQLAKTKEELERLQTSQHGAAIAALDELRCFNGLNRELLRAELEEFRLTTLLQKNLSDSEKLRGDESEFGRVTLATLSANRDSLTNKLIDADRKKREALGALQNGTCAGTA